eukprot:jgi/Chrzof1/8560/Cz03g15200.t1
MPGSSPPQSPAAVLSNINQVPQHHVTPPCLSCRSEPVGPVAYLHQRGIQVLVKETSLAPHFFFAYTNPAYDVDVSAQMHHAGMVEKAISHIFFQTLYKACQVHGKGLVADVGGNFGWFSLLSASMGCSVISWEPVPQFRAFFEYSTARNGLVDKIQIRPAVVVSEPGKMFNVIIPQRGIWGLASIGGANLDKGVDNQGEYGQVSVVGEAVDDVIGDQHVHLLKADVEGFEPGVIASAQKLLAAGRIDNVIMEYSPGVNEKQKT